MLLLGSKLSGTLALLAGLHLALLRLFAGLGDGLRWQAWLGLTLLGLLARLGLGCLGIGLV